MLKKKTEEFVVGGRHLTLSNLNKIFYPGEKFTKARVIDYYIQISKWPTFQPDCNSRTRCERQSCYEVRKSGSSVFVCRTVFDYHLFRVELN